MVQAEINLLLCGGSIPSGAGLRVFTGTKGCRKMINGGSGTDEGRIFAFILLHRTHLIE